MKIFSNQFAIHLQLKPDDSFPAFETESLPGLWQKILEKGLLFPGEVFFVAAEDSDEFVREVFELQTHEGIAEARCELIIQFDSEKKLDKFFRKYSEMFRPMPAAGGLVLDETNQLLIIFRNGFWDLPKGKLEKGEDIAVAAVREVEEETGLVNPILGGKYEVTWHVFPKSKGWVMKDTHWYLMNSRGPQKLIPQEKEGITKIEWTRVKDFVQNPPVTYPMIQDLVRKLAGTPWK